MPRSRKEAKEIAPARRRPIVRFSTFGTVKQVLAEVDAVIPRLFPKRAAGFKTNLKKLIRLHSNANKWEYIALIVSQGMARRELDEFIGALDGHNGPIIIDPTARTPDHQTFDSQALVRTSKERMVMVNEATDDVLIILHGLDNIDIEREIGLFEKSLAGMAAALGIAATMLGLEDKNAQSLRLLRQAEEHIKRAREKNAKTKRVTLEKRGARDGAAKDDFEKDDEDLSQEMFYCLAFLAQLQSQLQEDAPLEAMLEGIILQIKGMPQKFKGTKISFRPYELAAMRLLNVEMGAYVGEPRLDPAHLHDNTPDAQQLAKPSDPNHHHHKYQALHIPRLKPE